jgi:hypothetical protein
MIGTSLSSALKGACSKLVSVVTIWTRCMHAGDMSARHHLAASARSSCRAEAFAVTTMLYTAC